MLSLRRALVAVACATVCFAAGVGCGSSGAAPALAADAQAVCPVTPADTIAMACATEGLVCGPQYSCGATLVPLYCVCTQGTFDCRDGLGNSLGMGDSPSCPGPPAPPPACPSSMFVANLSPCSAPGQICAYASACPNVFDECTCAAGTTASGGFGKVFVCEPAVCSNDAAVPPPGVDSGPDADAAPPEAAPADAPAPADAGEAGASG